MRTVARTALRTSKFSALGRLAHLTRMAITSQVRDRISRTRLWFSLIFPR